MAKTREKTYIVWQNTVEKEDATMNGTTIEMGTIMRRVKAKTPQEAIGKYIVDTNDIIAIRKLSVMYVEYDLMAEL